MSDSNQYLYRLNPVRPGMVIEGPSREEESVMERHVSYLADLTDKGIMLMAGRTQNADENTFGIVIFRADSEEAWPLSPRVRALVRLLQAAYKQHLRAIVGTVPSWVSEEILSASQNIGEDRAVGRFSEN